MDTKTLYRFRETLTQHRDSLLEWLDTDPGDNKRIHLGGMGENQVWQMITDLKSALERIDNGNFGRCTECEGEVEIDRLEIDYTEQVCLDHYSEDKIRSLEQDLELASKVQQQLLPSCVPVIEGLEIATFSEPIRIVGGDYYDFFLTKNCFQGITIADVMGKGLPASMLMSNLQASLRILGPEYKEIHSLAGRLNNLFSHNLKLLRFISIFLGEIDIQNKKLKYCNAGHFPPIWMKSKSNTIQMLDPTGPAIGLTQHAEYKTEEIYFDSGDLFLLYTDGLTEALNSEGEEFGSDRLIDFVIKNAEKPNDYFVSRLIDQVKNFSKKLHDDVTLMVIKID
jgi:sigma-B regulation protein RsbU (phosphoserine phosphatase)